MAREPVILLRAVEATLDANPPPVILKVYRASPKELAQSLPLPSADQPWMKMIGRSLAGLRGGAPGPSSGRAKRKWK